ncbi:MAG: penicillin-binding protein activator LpoB, partial [Saprospirales bacterium TMED214]
MGCASQYGHILAEQDKNLVGSHAAGAATWNPLVDASVAQLLGRCPPAVQPATFTNASTFTNAASALEDGVFNSATAGLTPGIAAPLATGPASVCFIGIENKSAEELGDFKDQLYERIDTQINSAETFRAISRRMVDAALLETRLRPDALFLPANRAAFAAALGRQGAPVDYLLYAT